MNSEEFVEAVSDLGINLTDKMLEYLNTYYKMLISYNEKVNLTRITEKDDVYLKHFYDSLTISKALKLSNQKILDVGTGAGFPGLVLKIVFPDIKLTLVDALEKRVVFLKEVINKLRLKDVEIYHERAEVLINNNREKYDVVTSRAVAKLNVLSELCIPYVKLNGYFIAMKTDNKEEAKEAKKAIETLGGVLIKSIDFMLPKENINRTLFVVEKKLKTPTKYPRKFSEIKKKPL